jgi:phosphohistidine phosphatase
MAPTRRVYVLRHAKSSWDDPALADHDRPLNERGRRAAKAMRRHLAGAGIAPDVVLCSTAVRARQTLERLEPALDGAAVSVDAQLYGAGARTLLDRMRALPESVGSVMVIGHNPGLQELVLGLAAPGPSRDRVALKFPTAALATLAFDAAGWRALAPGAAELVAYTRPRDLAG